ncbi:MAG: hypothetical protein WCO60_18820 [Verrucomicrobiota bacterium]
MKKLVSIFSLTVALALVVSFGGRMSLEAKGDAGGRFSKLVAAIKALEDAKEYLQTSPSEFKGKKQATIDECDKAILQLRQAME